MKDTNNAIRTVLRELPRRDAEALIRSFHLPPQEERFIIAHELQGKSAVEISMAENVSVETVKRRRKDALDRIAAELHI